MTSQIVVEHVVALVAAVVIGVCPRRAELDAGRSEHAVVIR
jgi:hypothetical protein